MAFLGRANAPDADLARADARHCESITRAHARTFALASTLLPAPKRRGAYAIYAFCRLADDIVDRGATRGRLVRTAELERYRTRVRGALSGDPDGPGLRELARCVREFSVPSVMIEELLDGVARDLQPVRYPTWADLSAYCAGVASSVGAICTRIFGVAGDDAVRERAERFARTLGVAMQLTNILRDVGEDAARGRVYLPDEDLHAFGLSAERVLRDPTIKDDPRWLHLMRHEVARARALYRAASPGIALLAPDAQGCARACADGYAAILGAIERNGYDSISRRARVGRLARAGLLWSAWRSVAEPLPVGIEGPAIEWRERIISRPEEMGRCA